MKTFNVPAFYRSPLISKIKEARKLQDPRKKDLTPSEINVGSATFLLARHFGFCYGVENAIEISFKALEENPGKRIFLLSQMIHNPVVNKDLQERGIDFLMDTEGNQLVAWGELKPEDVVIIPAFGTTLKIEEKLRSIGIVPEKYNTTCPFVERVWKKAEKLGSDNYSIVIHGKARHEETRATFSRSEQNSPSVILKDISEARILGEIILGSRPLADFENYFKGRYSENFNPELHLEKVGVINQTTMLATETHEIAEFFKEIMIKKYGPENIKDHFSDTRDTLCYATNENQDATLGLLDSEADLALVVGGYNSSNTSHLVELLERKFPTYFISGPEEILSKEQIRHFHYDKKEFKTTTDYLPSKKGVRIIITSGASCPDSVLEAVIQRITEFLPENIDSEAVVNIY